MVPTIEKVIPIPPNTHLSTDKSPRSPLKNTDFREGHESNPLVQASQTLKCQHAQGTGTASQASVHAVLYNRAGSRSHLGAARLQEFLVHIPPYHWRPPPKIYTFLLIPGPVADV